MASPDYKNRPRRDKKMSNMFCKVATLIMCLNGTKAMKVATLIICLNEAKAMKVVMANFSDTNFTHTAILMCPPQSRMPDLLVSYFLLD